MSGDSRRALAWPLVTMKCSIPCLAGEQTKFGVMMSGNFIRSFENGLLGSDATVARVGCRVTDVVDEIELR